MTKEEEQRLITKVIEASNYIAKNGRRGSADWIFLSDEYIQYLADQKGVTFDEMVNLIEEKAKFTENEQRREKPI